MQLVAPRAPYAERIALGMANSGLTGVLRYRLLDNDTDQNDPVYGPSIANIIEDPTGSGSYVFNGTAPATSRKYSPAWDTGPGTELHFGEDLFVTFTAAAPGEPSPGDLCTLEDVLRYVPAYRPNDKTNETFQALITAESQLIIAEVGRELRPAGEQPQARDFEITGTTVRMRRLEIGDLGTDDGLAVSLLNSDLTLDSEVDPDGLVLLYDGERFPIEDWQPITALHFTDAPAAGQVARITGSWGFANVPAFVREACAKRVLTRYVNHVAVAGTDFTAAVGAADLNFALMFRSAQDALQALQKSSGVMIS